MFKELLRSNNTVTIKMERDSRAEAEYSRMDRLGREEVHISSKTTSL